MSQTRRIEIYDTTLRDGTQGAGVSLSLVDKLAITERLDELGIDFIEGGYPLSNPKDVAYFDQVRGLDLKHAKVCAFGMTRRKNITAQEDEGMNALVAAGAPIITIVGKTWDLHVDEVLRVSRDENLAMIQDSVAFCAAAENVEQVFYDAEHFFDGYKANPDYALQTLQAAIDGGATRLVLCDTNGGSMPDWIVQAMREAADKITPGKIKAQDLFAIHPHNDAGLAVANALAAVDAGAVQVQGTLNGIGERCGNVDLTTVVANLRLKLGHACLHDDALPKLSDVARELDERAQITPDPKQPYLGANAFTHKGGMHVHAVQRIAHSYEHIEPAAVGNHRRILVSELSGASNIAATIGKKFGMEIDKAKQRELLMKVQDLEHAGYQFENAPASLELLAHELLGRPTHFWTLDHYRCIILRTAGDEISTEAVVKAHVNDHEEHRVGGGDGPVNALDTALRKCLADHYPQINDVHLTDYAVRVVNPTAETAAKVRVIIEFSTKPTDGSDPKCFSTVGVNENIVDASWQALSDAFRYHLAETTRPV